MKLGHDYTLVPQKGSLRERKLQNLPCGDEYQEYVHHRKVSEAATDWLYKEVIDGLTSERGKDWDK